MLTGSSVILSTMMSQIRSCLLTVTFDLYRQPIRGQRRQDPSVLLSLCVCFRMHQTWTNLNWCRSKMRPRWITIFNSACIIWTFEVAVKIVKYKNGIIETVQLDTCRFFCASRWKININTGRNIQIYSHVLFTKT